MQQHVELYNIQCLFLTFQMKCPYALKISAIELTLVAILFTTSFRFKFANFNRCGYNYYSVPVTISCDNIFSSWK